MLDPASLTYRDWTKPMKAGSLPFEYAGAIHPITLLTAFIGIGVACTASKPMLVRELAGVVGVLSAIAFGYVQASTWVMLEADGLEIRWRWWRSTIRFQDVERVSVARHNTKHSSNVANGIDIFYGGGRKQRLIFEDVKLIFALVDVLAQRTNARVDRGW